MKLHENQWVALKSWCFVLVLNRNIMLTFQYLRNQWNWTNYIHISHSLTQRWLLLHFFDQIWFSDLDAHPRNEFSPNFQQLGRFLCHSKYWAQCHHTLYTRRLWQLATDCWECSRTPHHDSWSYMYGYGYGYRYGYPWVYPHFGYPVPKIGIYNQLDTV